VSTPTPPIRSEERNLIHTSSRPAPYPRLQQNLYTLTGESLLAFKVDGGGSGRLEQIQELRDGVVDRYVT
jgi:hypothetical protein